MKKRKTKPVIDEDSYSIPDTTLLHLALICGDTDFLPMAQELIDAGYLSSYIYLGMEDVENLYKKGLINKERYDHFWELHREQEALSVEGGEEYEEVHEDV